ncbi:DEKNAAC104283 [Brettanomyces naardenensis]|uniref:DEKNAAC104283 n=1 Tax=Brettanomyces naardenensis TaxID=13370 RepID=A0A448YPW1_BRENA|nr:DEKNAAC104283 [Brettanomyces naardenensis]
MSTSLRKKPAKQVTKLMNATLQCTELSAAYGNCILKNYQNVTKDACVQEFMAYKKCVVKHMGRTF